LLDQEKFFALFLENTDEIAHFREKISKKSPIRLGVIMQNLKQIDDLFVI